MKQCVWTIALLVGVANLAVAQPELNFAPPTATARPGQPVVLELQVRWDGAASDVVVMPPEVPAIAWGATVLGATRGAGAEGQFSVTHRVEIVPGEPGDYSVPAITVPYSLEKMDALGGAAPSGVPHLLQTDPFTLTVRPDRTGLYLAGGVLAIVLIAAGLALLRRRAVRNAADAKLDPRSPGERAQAAMHDARRQRLDGNYYLYYVVLTQAAEMLRDAGGDPALAEKFAAQAQAVGYQGVRPTDDDMDGALRELERALAQSKETSLT